MSELLTGSCGVQEEVAGSSNLKQLRINRATQLQKKLVFKKCQSQQLDKNSQDQYFYPLETCVIMETWF